MPLVVGPRRARAPAGDDLRCAARRRSRRRAGMILAVPIAAAIKVVLDYAYPLKPPPPRIELPNEDLPPPATAPPKLLKR